MSIFQAAARALATLRTESASVPVVYTRGSTSKRTRAAIGHTNYTLEQNGVISDGLRARDYVFAAADIADFGEPRRGDTITEFDEDGRQISVNEALPLADELCYRYCDDFAINVRIHTKQVG